MVEGVRPTTGLIKKALFDILGDISGLYFLDLFAGLGTIGIEALKRNAKEVVFVEKDYRYIKEIKKELSKFKLINYELIADDVLKMIKRFNQQNKTFDIIFLDPPYHQELAKKTLKTLASYDILSPQGFIIVQHSKKEKLPDNLGDLILFRQKRYSESLLSFYQKRD
jgi:16S rRNA (guanine(966)-N(2))-methyltransferase RsmD